MTATHFIEVYWNRSDDVVYEGGCCEIKHLQIVLYNTMEYYGKTLFVWNIKLKNGYIGA